MIDRNCFQRQERLRMAGGDLVRTVCPELFVDAGSRRPE